jgi:hypothetical protein
MVEELSKQFNEKLSISLDEKIFNKISKINDSKIILLRQREIIKWLLNDLEFLEKLVPENVKKTPKILKEIEDKWGQDILKLKRPDLKSSGQWTTCLGQHIVEEYYQLLNLVIKKPEKIKNLEPDWEGDLEMIEVKTGTYYTTGTAHEKILGTPFKYCEVPILYKKPLKIFCLANAEFVCKNNYGNLEGTKCNETKKEFLNFFKEKGITYVPFSDLLVKF